MTLSSPTNEHAFLLWKYIQNYINLEILCLYVYLLSLSLSLPLSMYIFGFLAFDLFSSIYALHDLL